MNKNLENQLEEATQPKTILRSVFGYEEFRSSQARIINDVLSKKDALVLMPTGGGKSLCYQIPAICLPDTTVVVSPLISLMRDQVTALENRDVPAAYYNSSLSEAEKKTVLQGLRSQKYKLIYVAPESLFGMEFSELLKSIKVSLFAIDEAHCISVWGNDFRPEYTRLTQLKTDFKDVPIIALTATADQATRKDIVQQLQIPEAETYIESFERPNIVIRTQAGQNRMDNILRFLRSHQNESGIIYCLSRKSTEKLVNKLSVNGHDAAAYHAGMPDHVRNKIQRDFQNDKVKIICATIAFGMGIDKANVRFVIHFNMPKNIESYYQEIGRSGRDGKEAEALLFASWADMMQLRTFIDKSVANEKFKTVQYAKLTRMWEFANASSCRIKLILTYFGEFKGEPCGHCDNCLVPPQVFDGSILAQKAISALIRCKEEIGINLLIDVLRGSSKEEIKNKGYQNIKTFGAGRDVPFSDWKDYITQMINQGIIAIDYTEYSKLKLTPLTRDILKGAKSIQLVKPRKFAPRPKKITKKELLEQDLYDLLKEWRLQYAEIENQAASSILNDATLDDLVKKKPVRHSDLILVEGMGQASQKKYGHELTSLIRKYLINQKHSKNVKGITYLQTMYLYEQGIKPKEIATMRKLNFKTICGHLALLYEQGEPIDIYDLLNSFELNTIVAKWNELSQPEELKTVFDTLSNKYDYYQIRAAIRWAKTEGSK